ncbi:MAG: hypothetical protein ACXU9B_04065 [Reyranella sp.]
MRLTTTWLRTTDQSLPALAPGREPMKSMRATRRIEGAHRYRLDMTGHIQLAWIVDAAVVRLEERTELIGNHDVERQAVLHSAERVSRWKRHRYVT